MRSIAARIAGMVLAAVLFDAQAARVRDVRPLMGTAVEVVAEGGDEARLRSAVEAGFEEMARLSAMMNHYDPGSRVSAVNALAGIMPVSVPPQLIDVLMQAERVSRRSRGAFDVTIGAVTGWRFRADDPRLPKASEVTAQLPKVDYRKLRIDHQAQTVFLAEAGMRIDLGGIAKIYILEAGRALLEQRGVPRALVNGGGDVVAHSEPNSPPWRVGVRDPREPSKLLGLVELPRGCVASSGDYERFFVIDGRRYHHILDPRTGYPAEGLRGVTLMAEDAQAVNGLSVAAMVLGKQAAKKLLEDTPGVEALFVDRDGDLWMSRGMRRKLVDLPSPEAGRSRR